MRHQAALHCNRFLRKATLVVSLPGRTWIPGRYSDRVPVTASNLGEARLYFWLFDIGIGAKIKTMTSATPSGASIRTARRRPASRHDGIRQQDRDPSLARAGMQSVVWAGNGRRVRARPELDWPRCPPAWCLV